MLPGEAAPSETDLRTEGSLTREDRLRQRRYTLIERFDQFLSPTGRQTLEGPDPERIPTTVDSQHMLLMRIEVSPDKESDVDLAAAGAGAGREQHGAVAAFAIPPLRYMVGTVEADGAPREGSALPRSKPVAFEWSAVPAAELYRLTVVSENDAPVWTALVKGDSTSYIAPAPRKRQPGVLRWQVVALDKEGSVIAENALQTIKLTE